MTDMDVLVNLYNLPFENDGCAEFYEKTGIAIKRVLSCDKTAVLDFIKEEFSQGWADEAEKAIFNNPSTCFIAVKDKKVIAFACYDSTALGYYGPLGVAKSARGLGIGTYITRRALLSMREAGYGYCVFNAGPVDYYVKTLNAMVIGEHPGVYKNTIGYDGI